MQSIVKKGLIIALGVFLLFGLISFGKNFTNSQVEAQQAISDTASTSMQTYTGIITSVKDEDDECEKNTGNETKLCYFLSQSRRPAPGISSGFDITGGSDRLNTRIANSIDYKVEVTGFWVNVTDPFYFVIKKMTVISVPTPTPK